MSDFPAFLFYPEDFAAGTADMAPDAIGIYVRCLCHQWAKGFVPNDKGKVARISGATGEEIERVWADVTAKFSQREDGQLVNDRMEVERQKLLANRDRRAMAGKTGAAARWSEKQSHSNRNGKRIATALRTQCDDDGKTMASRLVNVNVNEDVTENESLDSFEEFWKAFPPGRKKSKARARAAFDKAAKKCEPTEIIRAAAEYAASHEGRGEFVKMPETWLNGECWSDDRCAWKSKGTPRGSPSSGNPAIRQGPGLTYDPNAETRHVL